MAEQFVPCMCPACKGSLVTRYTRRKHARLYSDIEVAKKDSGEDKDKDSRSLFTHAQPTLNIDETTDTIDIAVPVCVDDGTEPLSLESPDLSPYRSYATDDEKVILYAPYEYICSI